MREIQASVITDTIERLCIEANQVLPDDIKKSIQACRASEDGQIALWNTRQHHRELPDCRE